MSAVRRLLPASAVLAIAAAWWFCLAQANGPLPSAAETLARLSLFAGRLLGAGSVQPPAWAQGSRWASVAALAGETAAMSVLATAFAGATALLSAPAASRLLGARGRLIVRALHVVARAVPELVWALLVVFVLRPGVLAGAIALALHEFGVLGRLLSDALDDVDAGPIDALRSAGAGRQAVLWYGILPQVLPQFVTFLLYRWEVVVRATVVVGFVAAAGLGYQLRLDLSLRRWTDVALLLACSALLVAAAEAVAAGLRRLAR